MSIGIQIAWWALLVWFLVLYTGHVRRWLAGLVLALLALAAVIHITSPHGVLFERIERLVPLQLTWGESINLAQGPANTFQPLANIFIFAFLVLAADTCLRLKKEGQGRKARVLGAGLLILIAALIHGSLVDRLLVHSPYLFTYAFLALLSITSMDMALEVARASQLSREIAAKEQRWSTLLEQVHLLVVGISRDGRIDYANPEFERVSDYSLAELIGLPSQCLLRPDDQKELGHRFETAILDPNLDPESEVTLVTREGKERTVVSSNVLLKDSDGEPTGMLSIGADITEKLEFEVARDAALGEISALKLQLERENLYLKEEIQLERGFTEIVGQSNALKYVLHKIEQVAPTDAMVLIEGETGVGKDLEARAIHEASGRSACPFVVINCAALAPNLIESELFGHERGAFTDASQQRLGRFEVADGGTLLLDEIGELPLHLQAKLLRVLEATGGRIAGRDGAAEVLGLPASTLRSRVKKLGIRIDRTAN